MHAAAQRCAKLHVPDPRAGRDALIAATAIVHGMTVVTRNAVDFEPIGAALGPLHASVAVPFGVSDEIRIKRLECLLIGA